MQGVRRSGMFPEFHASAEAQNVLGRARLRRRAGLAKSPAQERLSKSPSPQSSLTVVAVSLLRRPLRASNIDRTESGRSKGSKGAALMWLPAMANAIAAPLPRGTSQIDGWSSNRADMWPQR